MQTLCTLTATDLIESIQRKKVSALEVMTAHLAQIDRVNPQINALTQRFKPEHCLAEAKIIDQAIANGQTVGPLAGLPVVIKDALYVKDLICSTGNLTLAQAGPSTEDAFIVSRLKEAGAIIIGLSNVPELCRGGDSDNLLYGRTNNPYDLSRTPGGSSGGSAALVAAGGVPFAIGSDGGGSIVQPCHCTGIAGLKPTHGLVSSNGSIGGSFFGLIGSMICYGPMARSVQDLQRVLSVIACVDPLNPYSIPLPIQGAAPLKTLNIAYFTDNDQSPVDPEIKAAVTQAALALQDDVANVRYDRPACLSQAFSLHWDLFLGGDKGANFKLAMQQLNTVPSSWELQEFQRQAENCTMTTSQLNQRMVDIDRFRFDMKAFMQHYDILISPVFPTVAKPHGIGIKEISDFSYAMTHNLTGWPTVVIRCGTSSTGLPIGVMIAARPWHDSTALAVAERLEQILGPWPGPAL